MKMTIVTNKAGDIIGAVQGHALSEKVGKVEASVSFEDGYQLHQVDVADDMAMIDDVMDYQRKLAGYLQAKP